MVSHRSSRVLLICLVAGSLTLVHGEAVLGVQPTMGFTRPFVFPPSPDTNLHWIALPGLITQLTQELLAFSMPRTSAPTGGPNGGFRFALE
jgi:hypothetical protein